MEMMQDSMGKRERTNTSCVRHGRRPLRLFTPPCLLLISCRLHEKVSSSELLAVSSPSLHVLSSVRSYAERDFMRASGPTTSSDKALPKAKKLPDMKVAQRLEQRLYAKHELASGQARADQQSFLHAQACVSMVSFSWLDSRQLPPRIARWSP
eukprot:5507648-Pleurochrysis_carterae.AAC.1